MSGAISFIAGQRWISESEPELGLATVIEAGAGRVRVLFPAAGETRTYAIDNAPLKRVHFRKGDRIKTHDGRELTITEVRENRGVLTYLAGSEELPEAQLSDRLSLQGPQNRLFAGRFDEPAEFELRRRTLTLLHRSRKSPVRGFVGGRIDLIPHQLYIAHEVAGRQAPRVMLSDEVGLGKTIEACLILHRLLLSGRADRILVLVPETLVHQWFIEMLRRFNVWLNIFDEERCAAIEAGDPGANPFLDDQLVLTSIDFLAGSPRRAEQSIEAGWDVLVVDEAHHLQWSRNEPSREYQIVEAMSRRSEGLLLLTATPEQLGVESHFARLRLLDPDRYGDLAAFEEESKEYKRTAEIAGKLMANTALTPDDAAALKRLLGHDSELEQRLELVHARNAEARRAVLDDLLDLHGPGRVLFRNTRASVRGFPKRHVNLVALSAEPDAEVLLDRLSSEFVADAGGSELIVSHEFAQDPRILWLEELLRQLAPHKVLLICRSLEKAEAIDAALRRHVNLKMAVFHEGLTLLQRDRHAAWFAEAEGARLLICSEIGSEGRNFQFAHHLVLFDLPLNPELLEQRIGRLDRIGQTQEIEIHVPYVARSPQEVLARWYHDGLNAFESNLEGANELLRMFGRAVHDLALEFPVAERGAADGELSELVQASAKMRREMRQLLEHGRDRLLEMNSFRPAVAGRIVDEIQREDQDTELEDYMLDVFDHYGVHVEELAPRTWQLNPEGVITDSFPAMPEEGMIATCDRRRALAREDVGFLTWDHPMVSGAMELLLGSETGNCAFAMLPVTGERSLLLEMIFVLEPIAAARLHVDRFLPATPMRFVINQKLEDVTEAHSDAAFERKLQKGAPFALLDNDEIMRRLLPSMLERGSALAEKNAAAIRQSARAEMNKVVGHEVNRLKMLMEVNSHIRADELQMALRQQQQLRKAIEESRIRFDALRLIWKGPLDAFGS